MKISELRDWATARFGAHSHQEGQVLAALQPLEEWLGHLARQGVQLELTPLGTGEVAPAVLHDADEPATLVNSGGTTVITDAEASAAGGATPSMEVPLPDVDTFVSAPSKKGTSR